MNSTITTTQETQYTEEDIKLVRDALKFHDGLSFLELTLLDLVAPLKKDFLKEELLDRTLALLNAKNKHSKVQKGYKKLEDRTGPPTSLRFKLELTSPEPEVVASDGFRALKVEFETKLETFQTQAARIFLKTKMMDMEAAKTQLQSLFYTNINSLLEIVAEYEMERMPNEADIDKLRDIGSHKLFVAQAWKNIIAESTTSLTALEPNTNDQATFFHNISRYLKAPTSDIKSKLLEPYTSLQTGNLRSAFSTEEQISDVNNVVDTLEHFILTVIETMTTTIHNNYTRHQRVTLTLTLTPNPNPTPPHMTQNGNI